MSAALRDGMKDVNQICSKVRQCLYEMEEHDINYRRFQTRSTPDLLLPIAYEDLQDPGQRMASSVSQSENHMRVVLGEITDKVGRNELPLKKEENQENKQNSERIVSSQRVNQTDDEYMEQIQKCLELIKDDVVEISHSFQQDYKNLSEEIEAETKEKQQRLEKKAAVASGFKITDYNEIVRQEDEFERQREEIMKEKEELARQKQKIAEQIAKINEQKKLIEEKYNNETQSMQGKQQIALEKKPNEDKTEKDQTQNFQAKQLSDQTKLNESKAKRSTPQNLQAKQNAEEAAKSNEEKQLNGDNLEIDEILNLQAIQQIAEHIVKINEKKNLNEDKIENDETEHLQADPSNQQKDVESGEQNANAAQSLTPKAGFESIVCKSKGILDIHEKLITQMEACDSLWEFERKMLRDPNKQAPKPLEAETQSKIELKSEKSSSKIAKSKPSKSPSKIAHSKEKRKKKDENRTIKISKIDDKYNNKYKDSLWFSNLSKRKAYKENTQKDHKRPVSSQSRNRPSSRSLGNQNSTRSVCSASYRPCSAHKSCNLVIENTQKIDPNKPTEKSRSFWMKFQTGQLQSGKSLNCVDILDELTAKDVEPIQSEYPRRDNFYIEKHSFVQNTFIYKMVNNKTNNKMLEILSSLEPPRIRCSSDKCTKCTKHHNKGKHSAKGGKKNSGKECERKASKHRIASDDVAQKLRPYLTDPNLRYRTTITVMPVAVYFDGPPPLKDPAESNTSSSSTSYLYTSGDFPRNIEAKKYDLRVKTKQMSTEQRKLWSTKYQKFAGQHLVSFIESLPPLPSKITEINKTEQQKINQLQTVELYKRQQKTIAKKPINRSPPPKPKTLTPRSTEKETITVHKTMKTNTDVLNNIKTIAKKNFIETDIKKIIQMIEMKIVDILSVPEKQNAEAFNSIEKQIRYVLRRMRKIEASKHGTAKEEKIRMLKLTALETILDCDKDNSSLWHNKQQNKMDVLRAKIDSIESSKTSVATNESNEEKYEVTAVCSPTKKDREINEKRNDKINEINSTNNKNELKITEVVDESLQSSNSGGKSEKISNKSSMEMSQGTDGEIWIINKNIENLNKTNSKEELEQCDIDDKCEFEESEDKCNMEELQDKCDTEETENKYDVEEPEDSSDLQKNSSESENSNSLTLKQKHIVTQTDAKLSVASTDEFRCNLLNKPSVQSYHSIMEFLDKLTSTSDDACSVLMHYRHDVRVTDEEYVPIIYYPCLTHQTLEISNLVTEISTQTALKTKSKSKSNKTDAIKNLEFAGKEHKRLLDAVYSVVFTVVYFALRLNYSCK